MNNASDYLTGDDMMARLIADGGSEAATYAPSDVSTEAVIARFREVAAESIYPHAVRYTPVSAISFYGSDIRALLAMGYIADSGTSTDYYLTDMGAAFVNGVTAEIGCSCSARDHLIRAANGIA